MNISPTITWEILKQAPAYRRHLKCLLCLHEKLAIITHPSQNTRPNKKSEILSKCKHENTYQVKHFNPYTKPIHHTYTTSTTKNPTHPFTNYPTTHPLHQKSHLPLLNLCIHFHACQPVDIMSVMFSWLLEIRLHTVYLTHLLCTHHHIYN